MQILGGSVALCRGGGHHRGGRWLHPDRRARRRACGLGRRKDSARAKVHELIAIAAALVSGAGILNGLYVMAILEPGLARDPEALTAAQLFTSPNTVEYHPKKVSQKLGVRSRIHLAKAIPDPAGETV